MIYGLVAIAQLARTCAPEVAPEAVVPLVITESGGNSLAINVNRGWPIRVNSIDDGAALARRYIAAGYTVDIGLAQINSANFERLGVTLKGAFDPCTNLSLASTLLQAAYGVASRHFTGLDAISATFSLYNTGTLTRGFLNGYVGRIWSAAGALRSISAVPARPMVPSTDIATIAAVRRTGEPDGWFFGQTASISVGVFR